jgi:arylsulfatase
MARQSPHGLTRAHLPGYEGHLSKRVAPLPLLLRNGGYHTYMAGKWHLGTEPDHSPKAAGFERSFGLVDGAGNHWDGVGFFEGGSTFREDGAEVEWPPGRYSTELYTDRLIEFIDSGRDDGRPFFAFAAYTSPHWPLQVPEDELDRYRGAYAMGYDRLRELNFRNLKAAGIVPKDWPLPPRYEAVVPWDTLDAEQQRRESRKMELYAAMVENLDGHVGRLLDYLEASGQLENTLVIFMSDNGAAAEDFYNMDGYGDYLKSHYDNAWDNMGHPDSFVSYGAQWAEAGSAPFRHHKTWASEGGMVAPMIVSGPALGVGAMGGIDARYLTVMDIAPTILELAGVEYPNDGTVQPMRGESFLTALRDPTAQVHDDEYVTALFHYGRAFLRRGHWKIVQNDSPFDEAGFALYDLASDPGESTDLSETRPEVRDEMLELWRQYRTELGIVVPADL